MKTQKICFVLFTLILFFLINQQSFCSNPLKEKVIQSYKTTEIARGKAFLRTVPVTVTDSYCERSSGGIHDFYSEGDYWWPDPQNREAPYICRDGQTNPGNFTAHRYAMVRLSEIVATLTSAYLVTGEQVYANKALEHLNAWFVDTTTRMSPNMLYAQAIYGRVTGRGIGLIDAYHFVEVARSIKMLEEKGGINSLQASKIKNWFSDFLIWMTTHKYGIDEMNTKNNHSVCWLATASSIAMLTQNQKVIQLCRKRFKTIALPNQMAKNGSFPNELARTKPYGYSLFVIDAMYNVAQILSNSNDNLFEFQSENGRTLKKGIEFIYPYIKDKSSWPFNKDIYIWDKWPVCHPSLLFAAIAYNNTGYLDTFLQLEPYPIHPEVIRNLPVRHPIIWMFD